MEPTIPLDYTTVGRVIDKIIWHDITAIYIHVCTYTVGSVQRKNETNIKTVDGSNNKCKHVNKGKDKLSGI